MKRRQPYGGDPARPELTPLAGHPDIWTVRSSSAARTYRIQVAPDARAAVCECPGYMGHAKCWHVGEAVRLAQQRLIREAKEILTAMTSPTETETGIALRDDDDGDQTALAPVEVRPQQSLLPSVNEIKVMAALAKSLPNARGHAVPVTIDSPAKAFAVMLAGWELGVRPMTAFRHLFVVNGRTEPDAQLMMGIVLAKDPTARFEFRERTSERCEVAFYRGGRLLVVSEYTAEDAVKSGQMKTERSYYDKGKRERVTVQVKDSPWLLYTRDMLAWAAIKRAVRLAAPDLLNAIEAVNAVDADSLLAVAEDDSGPIDMSMLEGPKQREQRQDEEPPAQRDPRDERPIDTVSGEVTGEPTYTEAEYRDAGPDGPEPPDDEGAASPGLEADGTPPEAVDDPRAPAWFNGVGAAMKEHGLTAKSMSTAIGQPWTLANAIAFCQRKGVDRDGLIKAGADAHALATS